MKLRKTAAVLPPPSLPRNVQFATAQRDVAVGPFRGAVVNLQLAVFQKACQRVPLIQGIAHSDAGWTLLREDAPVATSLLLQWGLNAVQIRASQNGGRP
jgi:hypothetical protein